MEHRFNLRKPISLDIMIDHQGLGLVSAQTLNISMGGMFIDTGRIRLPSNAVIQLSFTIESEWNNRTYSTSALVVHSGDDGVGIMFDTLNNSCNSVLLALIHNHQSKIEESDESNNAKICRC